LADDPRFATAAARIERRAEVNALLDAWAADKTVADFVSAFGQEGIPAAPVRSYAEVAGDPHVQERDMLQSVRGAEGVVPLVGPAAKLSRTPTRVRNAAPTLGQHNAEILAELGVDPAQVDGSSDD
jgi:crotonobetainyl-CoA:carnitine CoA-transferase CaiB-like acyl-CoA transferase